MTLGPKAGGRPLLRRGVVARIGEMRNRRSVPSLRCCGLVGGDGLPELRARLVAALVPVLGTSQCQAGGLSAVRAQRWRHGCQPYADRDGAGLVIG